MPAVAGSLLWECVKSNSSFIRKSRKTGGCPVMNAEPGNLMGLNSWKYSGLANRKVFDVKCDKGETKEKITVITTHKKDSRLRRPKNFYIEIGLNKNTKKALPTLEKMMKDGLYRKDLIELAKTKYAKVKKSFWKRKWVVKSRRARK